MDAKIEDLLRRTRANPADPELLQEALAWFERLGEGAPGDLLDRVVHPARTFETKRAFEVRCERPDGVYQDLGETPGSVELPEHRVWWVTPKPVKLSAPLVKELADAQVPGLTFGRSRSVTKWIPQLAELPHLSWLSLESTLTTDETLASFPDFMRLAELNLNGTKITHEGLEALAEHAPNLVRLSLDNVKKVKDLAPLARFPLLRRLSASRGGVGLKVIKAMPALPELTHLNLYGCPMSPSMLTALAPKVPGLRELNVDAKERVDDAFLAKLPAFSGLIALSARGVSWPDEIDLAPLTELKELRYLGLHLGSARDPERLRDLPRLTHLACTGLTDGLCEHVAQHPSLRRLTIGSHEGLTSAGFAALAKAPHLRRIDVTQWLHETFDADNPPGLQRGRDNVTAAEIQGALDALQGSRVELLQLDRWATLYHEELSPFSIEVPRPTWIVVPPETPPSWRPCGPWAILS